MTTASNTSSPRPPLSTVHSSIQVQQLPSETQPPPADKHPTASPEPTVAQDDNESDARRKQSKRRSGNSVDLTYRYREPSDDELSWTEDEHGKRRQRKSRKRRSGGGDDFKTGIM